MVILLVILAVTASQSLPICSTYCKALLSGIAVTWRSECECSYTSLPLDLNDSSVYYIPATANVKSVFSPPIQRQFLIPNPVLNKDNVHTKNFRKRVLNRSGKFISRELRTNTSKFLTQPARVQLDKNRLNFDIKTVVDEIHVKSKFSSNNIEAFKNNLITCIELHILNRTIINNCDLPTNFEFKNIKDDLNMTYEELETKIAKKCHQITKIIKESIADIKNKWRIVNKFNKKHYDASKSGIENEKVTELNLTKLLNTKFQENETKLAELKDANQISPPFLTILNKPKVVPEYSTAISQLETIASKDNIIASDANATVTLQSDLPGYHQNETTLYGESGEEFKVDNNQNDKNQIEKSESQTTIHSVVFQNTNTDFSLLKPTTQDRNKDATLNIFADLPELMNNNRSNPDPKDYFITTNDTILNYKINKNLNEKLAANSTKKSLINNLQSDDNSKENTEFGKEINKQLNVKLPSNYVKESFNYKSADDFQFNNIIKNRNQYFASEPNKQKTGFIKQIANKKSNTISVLPREHENDEKYFKSIDESSLELLKKPYNHIQEYNHKLNSDKNGIKKYTTSSVITTDETSFNDLSFPSRTISLRNSDINQNLTITHQDMLLKSKDKIMDYSTEIINSSYSNDVTEEKKPTEELQEQNNTQKEKDFVDYVLVSPSYKITQIYETNANDKGSDNKMDLSDVGLNDLKKQIRPRHYGEVPIISIVSREYPNGTVSSFINGTEVLPSNDFKDGEIKTNLQITGIKTNNTTRYSEKIYYLHVVQPNENENKNIFKEQTTNNTKNPKINNTIFGKLYFLYRNQLIPAQFVQDPDGYINIGINLFSRYNERDEINDLTDKK